jgi:nucleoside permease NupC
VYALCGFGNISSLGIQIGVLSSLAPTQKAVIARGMPDSSLFSFMNADAFDHVAQVGFSALIVGTFTTLQTAAIGLKGIVLGRFDFFSAVSYRSSIPLKETFKASSEIMLHTIMLDDGTRSLMRR